MAEPTTLRLDPAQWAETEEPLKAAEAEIQEQFGISRSLNPRWEDDTHGVILVDIP